MADITKAQNQPTRKPLTQERLRKFLSYDPISGDFTWIVKKGRSKIGRGDKAGTRINCSGIIYRKIKIDQVGYFAHQLAWFYIHGIFTDQIDHKDGNGENNSIDNLRPCTQTQNNYNKKRSTNNSSGYKGVWWHKKRNKWAVSIINKGRQEWLGFCDDPAQGSLIYMERAKQIAGQFARVG